MRIFLFSAIIFIVLSSALNNGNAQQPPTVYTVRVDGRDYVTSGEHATHFSFRGSNLYINGKYYENHPPPMKRIVSRATDLENEESENRLKEQQSLNKASSSKNAEAAEISTDDEKYYSLSESEDDERNPGTYVYVPASENDQTGDGYHIFVPDEPAQGNVSEMPSTHPTTSTSLANMEISSDEEPENEASDSEDEESMPSIQPIMPPAFPTHIQNYFQKIEHDANNYMKKLPPQMNNAKSTAERHMGNVQKHMKIAKNKVEEYMDKLKSKMINAQIHQILMPTPEMPELPPFSSPPALPPMQKLASVIKTEHIAQTYFNDIQTIVNKYMETLQVEMNKMDEIAGGYLPQLKNHMNQQKNIAEKYTAHGTFMQMTPTLPIPPIQPILPTILPITPILPIKPRERW